MALHEQAVGATDEWYTPPYIFDAMGINFDLDVACPNHLLKWIPASTRITENSLEKEWNGFVWMNPPFGKRNGLLPWLEKFTIHNNGVALVPDRTSAPWWQQYAPQMSLILFVSPKIKFISVDGNEGRSPAQGTSLFALGEKGISALHSAASKGIGVLMKPEKTKQ